jgi:hypothetical protein
MKAASQGDARQGLKAKAVKKKVAKHPIGSYKAYYSIGEHRFF